MSNKVIPTTITAVYKGNERVVASEARMQKPENPDAVIAKNTVKEIKYNENIPDKIDCDQDH